MPPTLRERLVHSWNAFLDRNQPAINYGPSYSIRQDRVVLSTTSEQSIAGAIYNQIAVDVSLVPIQHVRLDENQRYIETIDSGLNNCFTVEANIDQSAQEFVRDVVISMFDEGCVALVPIERLRDPILPGTINDVLSLRTGKILEWYPEHVRMLVYNEKRGIKEELVQRKKDVAIIENPLYQIMNQPNSILKRLVNKLNLLDAIDTQSGSGKLDIIIQLPYVIKTEARKAQAEARRKLIEEQLANSKYGIAYADAAEKITQLNRPAENNLMTQVEYLTRMLYGQLGLTQAVFDGTADEKTMNNYYKRSVDPVLSAIAGGLKRTFLTKTARTQGQSIAYFRDPFGLVLAKDWGGIADSFTRNAIFSSNDFRSRFGYKPDKDPDSDKLRNKNLNPPTSQSNESAKNDEESEGDTVDEKA